MSAEDFVTVPRKQLDDLRAEIARARAEAQAADLAAVRANEGVAELGRLIVGLREVLDQRIQGALHEAGEEPEPVSGGFARYRERVLASERKA